MATAAVSRDANPPHDSSQVAKLTRFSYDDAYEKLKSYQIRLFRTKMRFYRSSQSLRTRSGKKIDDLDYIAPPKGNDLSPIYLTDEAAKQATISVTLHLAPRNSKINDTPYQTALFYVRSEILLRNLCDYFTIAHGLYPRDIDRDASHQNRYSQPFRTIESLASQKIDQISETISSACDQIFHDEPLKRLRSYLATISYSSHPDEAPGLNNLVHSTHLLLGAKGWSQAVSQFTLESVLDDMRIELVHNDETIAVPCHFTNRGI